MWSVAGHVFPTWTLSRQTFGMWSWAFLRCNDAM